MYCKMYINVLVYLFSVDLSYKKDLHPVSSESEFAKIKHSKDIIKNLLGCFVDFCPIYDYVISVY